MLNNNTSEHKEFLKSLNWQVIKLNNNTHNSNLYPKASIFYKKNALSIFLYKKKHYDDFQARKDGGESTSPSPWKEVRLDTPGFRAKD